MTFEPPHTTPAHDHDTGVHARATAAVPSAARSDYRPLFDHAGVGLLELSFDGRVLLINRCGADFFACAPEALLGRNVADFTHPADIPKTHEAFRSVMRGDVVTATLEKRYLRADGRVVWSRSRLSLLKDTAGHAHSLVAVIADITELKQAQADLEAMNEHLQATLQGGLLGLGVALEARDLETSGHTERVVALSTELGRALGLSAGGIRELQQGAYLHDLGKLMVPDAVLLKPGKLDAAEWQLMMAHATNGHAIAAKIPTLSSAALDVIRHHHERWDGSGYPDRLRGDDIPLLARIFTVADVYDALLSERPYKRAWTREEAVREIREQAGRQFDPAVVEAFTTLAAES